MKHASSAPGVITFTLTAGFIVLALVAWQSHVMCDVDKLATTAKSSVVQNASSAPVHLWRFSYDTGTKQGKKAPVERLGYSAADQRALGALMDEPDIGIAISEPITTNSRSANGMTSRTASKPITLFHPKNEAERQAGIRAVWSLAPDDNRLVAWR